MKAHKKVKMNVRLLRKIQTHILEEPKRYNQNLWIITPSIASNIGDHLDFPACGMMACIGGWAQLLNAKTKRHPTVSWTSAKRTLGLSEPQAMRLFDSVDGFESDQWPPRFAKAYLNAKTPAARARIAVRRIDHFIATKGEQ